MTIWPFQRLFLCLPWIVAIGHFQIPKGVVLAAEPQRVRIAYASRSNSATPQYLAQSKGFFKADGPGG